MTLPSPAPTPPIDLAAGAQKDAHDAVAEVLRGGGVGADEVARRSGPRRCPGKCRSRNPRSRFPRPGRCRRSCCRRGSGGDDTGRTAGDDSGLRRVDADEVALDGRQSAVLMPDARYRIPAMTLARIRVGPADRDWIVAAWSAMPVSAPSVPGIFRAPVMSVPMRLPWTTPVLAARRFARSRPARSGCARRGQARRSVSPGCRPRRRRRRRSPGGRPDSTRGSSLRRRDPSAERKSSRSTWSRENRFTARPRIVTPCGLDDEAVALRSRAGDLDPQDRVQPEADRVRVRRGARLRVAVDRHGVRDRRKRASPG